MCDIESLSLCTLHIEFKTKIIEVLSKMEIKNRTILEEFKLLTIVKRWADQVNSEKLDEYKNSQLTTEDESDDEVKILLNEMVGKVSEKLLNEDIDALNQLNEKSKSLYEVWNGLKVDFKIPKKQRIEERKEHERELKLAYNNTNNSGGSVNEVAGGNVERLTGDKFNQENTARSNY